MSELIVPSWFKGRQAKAEPAGENLYRLSGPNLPEAFIGLRKGENGLWTAFLRRSADGPELAVTAPEFTRTYEAWEAAFELFRTYCIV